MTVPNMNLIWALVPQFMWNTDFGVRRRQRRDRKHNIPEIVLQVNNVHDVACQASYNTIYSEQRYQYVLNPWQTDLVRIYHIKFKVMDSFELWAFQFIGRANMIPFMGRHNQIDNYDPYVYHVIYQGNTRVSFDLLLWFHCW